MGYTRDENGLFMRGRLIEPLTAEHEAYGETLYLGKIEISEQICYRKRSARMTRLCVEYSLEYSKASASGTRLSLTGSCAPTTAKSAARTGCC